MAGYTLPISQIQAASAYGSGLSRSPLSGWYKAINVVYAFPRIIRFITGELTNERIQAMTVDQARELYLPLALFHRELGKVLDQLNSRSWMIRLLLHSWRKSLERDAERIGDVAEALAWGTDQDLRKTIDGAITALEQESLHFS